MKCAPRDCCARPKITPQTMPAAIPARAKRRLRSRAAKYRAMSAYPELACAAGKQCPVRSASGRSPKRGMNGYCPPKGLRSQGQSTFVMIFSSPTMPTLTRLATTKIPVGRRMGRSLGIEKLATHSAMAHSTIARKSQRPPTCRTESTHHSCAPIHPPCSASKNNVRAIQRSASVNANEIASGTKSSTGQRTSRHHADHEGVVIRRISSFR